MNFFQDKKILVTGGKGFVGSHLVDALVAKGVRKEKIIIPDRRKDDLRVLKNCLKLSQGVDLVFHLAADIGGVAYSQSHPATQAYNCLMMDLNLIEASRRNGVEKIVLLSCSPAYPKNSPMPLKEENLFNGPPEESHFGFGWAKRTMAILAEAYHQEFGMDINVIIANNTYGPRDNFDPGTSHVIPALIRKCFEKKKLVVWGDGSPRRDFIYVGDLVEGIVLVAERLDTPQPVNLASGIEITIKDLVEKIVRLTGFKGELTYGTSRPKGQSRRVVDITKARKLGFRPRYSLERGLRKTINWYRTTILTK
ncbi:NAD-dependent epimerase/dehydratase family protein [Patescibacteria group bacterium]|nr:NAD-dependent epimerase/dehydratase family protein [Patescibacteria group bacterium]